MGTSTRSATKALAAVLVAALAAGCGGGATGTSTATLTRVGGTWAEVSPYHENPHNAIVRVRTARPEVALSFDDGPDPRWTPIFLRFLRRHDARATFFLVGRRAVAHPAVLRAVMRFGDEIGNHTLTHARLTDLRRAALMAEITGGARALVRAGAPRPRLLRPPFGAFDESVGAAVARSGELLVGWDLPLDHYLRNQATRAAARSLVADARPGSIILAHDGSLDRRRTLAALRIVLRGLGRRGFRVVPVGTLLSAGRRPCGERLAAASERTRVSPAARAGSEARRSRACAASGGPGKGRHFAPRRLARG